MKRGERTVAVRAASFIGLALLVSVALARPTNVCRADGPLRVDAQLRGLPAPDALYGALFEAVQTQAVFQDQKTFVDMIPRRDPAQIVREYWAQRTEPGFDLATFVGSCFWLPSAQIVKPPADLSLRDHIAWLWPALTRSTTLSQPGSSLIALPNMYVVPGGRFREVYYWDSYFTMLGLSRAGRTDLVLAMLENFAYEIDNYGHVPNGNRTYYLSRSQPPFFSHMVELAAQLEGRQMYVNYLPELRREYAYWMTGLAETSPGSARAHVVKLPDGTVLNRYWDEHATPRSESYSEDLATARAAAGRRASAVYRDLRAAAESGWDFSSRWFAAASELTSVRTTAIIPVDLNSLLFHLELSISKGCELARDLACAHEYSALAAGRADAIERYLWNRRGYYADYDWQLSEVRADATAAMVFPLFVGVASPEHARRTAAELERSLLAPGGLLTTTRVTGQQWDAPNAWAPLQWIAVSGLRSYAHAALARAIGTRFLSSVSELYAAEGKLVEKYRVDGKATGGGGGEYPLQDGFGWTNGVTLMLLALYDSPAAHEACEQPE